MKKLTFFAIVGLLLCFLSYPFDSNAKKKVEEVDIVDLSIDENIEIPKLGKYADKISAIQAKEIANLKQLSKTGYPYDIKAIRNGEVIMITVPMRYLFAANSTDLHESGKKHLEPILKYCGNDNLYKMVLVAHADNTGNDIYAKNITEQRVNNICDWIGEKHNNKLVVPYGLGNSDPIVDNNSVTNRNINRRLVIYIIPENGLIDYVKRNKKSIK